MTWKYSCLKEVAPSCISKKHFAPPEMVWYLTLDQIESNTGYIINKKVAPASEAGNSTYAFDQQNVLYSKLRPYLNKVVCPNEAGIATTELVPLKPKKGILDRRFLTYYLRSQAFLSFAKIAVAGAKMPRIIMPQFWQHKIPLPSLTEQQRIVEILDQADDLRKKRIEADTKADRILLALFYKMIGDPNTNLKGYPRKKLRELMKVKSGNFLPAKNMSVDGKYPVYGGNGINGYHSKYMFEKPMIVIGRVGAYCGIIHYSEPKCWITDNALYVTEYSDELDERYLIEALKLANLNQYAGRGGQPLISGSRIYPVKILVPKHVKQEEFANIVYDIYSIEAMRKQLEKNLNNIFNNLLHRAFSGALTAKWREAHMKELLAEMEEQAKELGSLKGKQLTIT